MLKKFILSLTIVKLIKKVDIFSNYEALEPEFWSSLGFTQKKGEGAPAPFYNFTAYSTVIIYIY